MKTDVLMETYRNRIIAEHEYAKEQERWVAEHGIKAGSVVRLTRHWEEDEDGFAYPDRYLMGDTFTVTRIDGDCILARGMDENGNKDDCWMLPYFALDPYADDYTAKMREWVEKVGLKVGDEVRIVSSWKKNDEYYPKFVHRVGAVFTVTEIGDTIKGKGRNAKGFFSEGWRLPYFALEKMKDVDSYIHNQAEWVRENNAKATGIVTIVSDWDEGREGFRGTLDLPIGTVGRITGIQPHYIVVQAILDGGYHTVLYLPYFALRYEGPFLLTAAFADAEEYLPFRDEWFYQNDGGDRKYFKPTSFDDDGVVIDGWEFVNWAEFAATCYFLKDNTPAGRSL